MSQKKAELLLAVIVIANSSSYLLTKVGMGDMGPFNLISIRFALAFLACLPFCFGRLAKASRATLRCAALLCLFMFSVMALQIYGLRTITSAEAGFFSSTTVIMLPFVQAALFRKAPSRSILFNAFLVMAGIGLMTLTTGVKISQGVWLFLGSALVYCFYILTTDYYAGKADLMAAGIWQMAMGAVLSFIFSLFLEAPRLPQGAEQWGVAFGLGVICSAFGMALQPVVQQFTTPERYGLLFGLSPVSSSLMGCLFLREQMALPQWAGCGLVLAGVLLAQRSAAQPQTKL